MIKVLELKGYKSLRAFNAFNSLMLGLKMLPAYMNEPYEEFYLRIQSMPELTQEKLIREAAGFVKLDEEELQALMSFCTDANGVPYSAENLKNIGPKELVDIVVAVCFAISKIKIDFVSDSEKKN